MVKFNQFKKYSDKILFLIYRSDETDEEKGHEKDKERLLSLKIMKKIRSEFFQIIDIKGLFLRSPIEEFENNFKKIFNTFNEDKIIYSYFIKNERTSDVDKKLAANKIYKFLKSQKKNSFINDEITTSKSSTSQIFKDEAYSIKTVTKIKNVDELTFPIIAKPDQNHSGFGIEVFKNIDELKNSKRKFDLFSEFLNKKSEFRAFIIKDLLVGVTERIEKSEESKVQNKNPDDALDFLYIEQDINNFYMIDELMKILKSIRDRIELDVYSVDFLITDKDEIKIIEINAGTGFNCYRIAQLFYGLKKICQVPILEIDKKRIDEYLLEHKKYLLKNYKELIEKSVSPIDFNDKKYEFVCRKIL